MSAAKRDRKKIGTIRTESWQTLSSSGSESNPLKAHMPPNSFCCVSKNRKPLVSWALICIALELLGEVASDFQTEAFRFQQIARDEALEASSVSLA